MEELNALSSFPSIFIDFNSSNLIMFPLRNLRIFLFFFNRPVFLFMIITIFMWHLIIQSDIIPRVLLARSCTIYANVAVFSNLRLSG